VTIKVLEVLATQPRGHFDLEAIAGKGITSELCRDAIKLEGRRPTYPRIKPSDSLATVQRETGKLTWRSHAIACDEVLGIIGTGSGNRQCCVYQSAAH